MEIKNKNSQHLAAIISGISILIMAFVAFFSYGYVYQSLVNMQNAAMTFHHIQHALPLFRFGILGWGIIILTDLIVTFSFYTVLKFVHKKQAILASFLRLLYTILLVIAVSHLVTVMSTVQTNLVSKQSQVMTSILAFQSIWSFGLILFGAHLLLVGYIIFKSNKFSKTISILLMISGISYMTLHLLYSFFPEINTVTALLEKILTLPMAIGELSFGILLLVKGIRKSL